MRRIDRYALSEMILPALVGVVILLILLLGDWLYRLLRFSMVDGVPARDILLLLWYRVPALLLQAIPGALLLGTALALNRLERDRELMSLRLAGVRLLRLVLPFILLGVLFTGVLFFIQERVLVPYTVEGEKLQQKVASGNSATVILPDVMFKVGSDTYFYAHRVDSANQKLSGVILMRMDGGARTWMTIPEAVNENGRWIFHRDPVTGTPPIVYYFEGNGAFKMSRYMTVDGVDEAASWLNVAGNRNLFSYAYLQATPETMTLQELLAMRAGKASARGVSTFLEPSKLDFFIHSRFSVPLAALVAVLIAIPFSVRFGRSGGYVGLLLSVLLSFFFVIAQQWTRVLTDSPNIHLNPIAAAWLPDAVFGLLGLIFLLREEKGH